MAAVWYHFRASFRRRAGSYVSVVVLLGLLGGVSMAALASARRTASSYPRFREAGNPSHIQVNPQVEEGPEFVEKIKRLPGVERTASYAAFVAWPLTPGGKADLSYADGEAVGSIDGLYFDQDRFVPTSGRVPDPSRADEIAVGEYLAESAGVRVGQRLTIGVWDPALEESLPETNPDPNDRLDVTVVGIGLFNDEVVQDEVDRTPRALFTPAFTQREAAYASYFWVGVQLHRGDAGVAEFKRAYLDLLPEGSPDNSRVNSVITSQAQRAIRPLAVALGTFGALCAVATLLLVGQALARLLASDREDLRIVRAMGSRPAQTAAMGLPGATLSIAGGVVLAVAVAVALSPLSPIGPVRRVEAEPGVSFDWTVLGIGALLLAVVLVAVTVAVAIPQSPHRDGARAEAGARQPSAAVGAAATAGLPAPAVAGMRLALERGAGRTAAPVGAIAAGAVVAVVAVVASVVFGSSLRALVQEPRLYGWDWDVSVLDTAGYGTISAAKAQLLDDHPDVAAWSGAFFGSVDLDGRTVPAQGVELDAAVHPPLLSGRHVRAPDEVVLGRTTLDELGKGVGDTVVLGRGDQREDLRIVGTASLPTVGALRGAYTSLGTGALLPSHKLTSAGSSDNPADAAGNAVFIRLRQGVDRSSATERLEAVAQEIGEYPGSATVIPAQRPAAIVNYSNMGATPTLLAGGLSLAVLVSLGLALAAGVRRRGRDLAVLKALGFTRRQLSATVSWQATITVVIGLVVGVPLGIAAGRGRWLLFADQLSVVARPAVPVVVVAALAAGLVLLGNAAAAVPAALAARTETAAVLRAE
jgi:ABC-type lipoprotein release transport system permease subunit